MSPTFEDGQVLLMGVGLALRPGDVIAFRDPMRPDLPDPPLLVKRISHFTQGGSGPPLGEPAPSEECGVYVRGDNVRSIDSRHFGPIALRDVYARWIV